MVETMHEWRSLHSCRGEPVLPHLSEHVCLEGWGESVYLIHLIDDTTGELTAGFVLRDPTEKDMRML